MGLGRLGITRGWEQLHQLTRRERCTEHAIVSLEDVIEAKPLPQGTSAQKAELMALTRALELSKSKTVNIYTDSRYAFLTLQVNRTLYKEKGLLNSGGKDLHINKKFYDY